MQRIEFNHGCKVRKTYTSIRWWNIITLNQERSDSGECPKGKSQRYSNACISAFVLFPFSPCKPLQSACQHSWYVSRSLYAACSPGSIFKMPENKWVWLFPASFICFVVKIQEEGFWHSWSTVITFTSVASLMSLKIICIYLYVHECIPTSEYCLH